MKKTLISECPHFHKKKREGGEASSFVFLIFFFCLQAWNCNLVIPITSQNGKKKFPLDLYRTFSSTFIENIFRSGLTLGSSRDCFCHKDYTGLITFPFKRSDEAFWLHPLRFLSDFLQLGLNHDLIFQIKTKKGKKVPPHLNFSHSRHKK